MGALFSKHNFDSDFEKNFNECWPTTQPEFSEFGQKLLKQCDKTEKPVALDIGTIVNYSSEFPYPFQVETCRIHTQPKERWDIIEQQAASAYPVVHERAIWLYLRFLEYKIHNPASNFEQEVYTNMSLTEFIQRLLIKRYVAYLPQHNTFSNIYGEGTSGCFENPVTPRTPNYLDRSLSYDEVKLSAFLSLSSGTEFLNDCDAKPDFLDFSRDLGYIEPNKDRIEFSGVVISIVPPFLLIPYKFDYQDVIINRKQNVAMYGYGAKKSIISSSERSKNFDYYQIWKDFYEENGTLYTSVKKVGKRFGKAENKGDFFDHLVLKKRYTIFFDTLLLESEAKASSSGKRGYLYIGPIGLEYWTQKDQIQIFLETFSQRLRHLLPKLKHISFVQFSSSHFPKHGDIRDGNCFKSNSHPSGGIRIILSDRKPAEKLRGPKFDDVLLIVACHMDANALPGNEFWLGIFNPPSGALIAYGSLIAELQNCYINKTMISGDNLHVASPDFGIIHIAEYAKRKLETG